MSLYPRVDIAVEHTSQYFYRAVYSQPGDSHKVERQGIAEDVSSHQFAGEPEEVCYALTRITLDGTELVMSETCLSTEGLDLGQVEERSGDVEGTLGSCVKPPVGEKERWCEHFEDEIVAATCGEFPSEACTAALKACDTDDDGAIDKGIIKNPEEMEDDKDPPPAKDKGGAGCSTNREAPGGSWPLALLLLALYGFGRRHAKAHK